MVPDCDQIKDILVHTWTCEESAGICEWPHCEPFKGLTSHWDKCDKLDCVPDCGKTNETHEELINMWRDCPSNNCPMCFTIKDVASRK